MNLHQNPDGCNIMKFDDIIVEDYTNKHDQVLSSVYNVIKREYDYEKEDNDT